MKISFPSAILIYVVSIIVAAAGKDVPWCCGKWSVNTSDYGYSPQCYNGQNPKLPCNRSDVSVFDRVNLDDEPRYVLQPDNDGTLMFVNSRYIIHSPNYCIGNGTASSGKKIQVILACTHSSKITRRKRIVTQTLWIVTIAALIFMVSGICLALTAAVYYFTPQTQNIEGRCTFHLTLNQSLSYLMGSYFCIEVDTIEVTLLEEFCISYWYMFIFTFLSFFVWSTLLAFHIRRRFRRNLRLEEANLMRRYLIIGYGIPAVTVAAGIVSIYGLHHFGKIPFFSIDDCIVHQFLMFFLFAVLPIVITQLISACFFISLQRQLWSTQPSTSASNSTNSNTKLRKFKFRFLLNAKLFVMTGLPVLLMLIWLILAAVTSGAILILFLMIGTAFFIAIQGVVVFYMLVISRKRILHGLAGKFGITLTGWDTCPESEESIAYSKENENDSNREL